MHRHTLICIVSSRHPPPAPRRVIEYLKRVRKSQNMFTSLQGSVSDDYTWQEGTPLLRDATFLMLVLDSHLTYIAYHQLIVNAIFKFHE